MIEPKEADPLIDLGVEKLMIDNRCTPGEIKSMTHRFRGSSGTTMYVTVGVDEFGTIQNMFINIGSSGTTIHNVCNTLARVISIAIKNDKATAIQIVQTMEDVSSETVWMSDTLGKADSIPSALALILLHHIALEEAAEAMHTGEEEEDKGDE